MCSPSHSGLRVSAVHKVTVPCGARVNVALAGAVSAAGRAGSRACGRAPRAASARSRCAASGTRAGEPRGSCWNRSAPAATRCCRYARRSGGGSSAAPAPVALRSLCPDYPPAVFARHPYRFFLQVDGPGLERLVGLQHVLGDLVRRRVRQLRRRTARSAAPSSRRAAPRTTARSPARVRVTPGLGTIATRISSSPSSEGTGTAATSNTPGCAWITRSISAPAMFSPRRRMMSFLRDTKVVVAVGVARHEVAGHEPAVAKRRPASAPGSRK